MTNPLNNACQQHLCCSRIASSSRVERVNWPVLTRLNKTFDVVSSADFGTRKTEAIHASCCAMAATSWTVPLTRMDTVNSVRGCIVQVQTATESFAKQATKIGTCQSKFEILIWPARTFCFGSHRLFNSA